MHSINSKLALMIPLFSIAVGQSAGVRGLVVSVSGSPIIGATVRYSRLVALLPNVDGKPRLAPGETWFSASSPPTDAAGNHATVALPAGTYLACVEVHGQPFLDPCKWEVAPSVQVRSGQTSDLRLAIKNGVLLKVRVNDAQGLLPTFQRSALDFPHLIVGVIFGTGAFLAAERVSIDATGQNYMMAVPSGTPLSLWLFSRHVSLADAQGERLPSQGVTIPFQAALGTDQTFTFSVTGTAIPK